MMLKSLPQALQLTIAITKSCCSLEKLNDHVQSPPADCSAAPINQDGKFNAKKAATSAFGRR